MSASHITALPWPADYTKAPEKVPSTLKAAFLDVLQRGITVVKGVITASLDPILAKDKKVFINITELGGIDQYFFLGVGGKVDITNANNLAHKLGEFDQSNSARPHTYYPLPCGK
jgi:hypothetical protein